MQAEKFIAYLKFAAHVVDAAHTNEVYRGVLFEWRGSDTLTMVGTDGKRIAIARTTEPHMMGDLDQVVTNYRDVVEHRWWGPTITALDDCLMDDTGRQMQLCAARERYPDWRRTLPGNGGLAALDMDIDPRYAAEAFGAMHAAGAGRVTMTAGRISSGQCLELMAEGAELRCVVMGLRAK